MLKKHSVNGIDIWRKPDQLNNSQIIIENNLHKFNLKDKVQIYKGNIVNLPFSDQSYDIVTASLVIHNIKNKQSQVKVIQEACRVLKSKGKILIFDLGDAKLYQQILKQCGMSNIQYQMLDLMEFGDVFQVLRL